MSVRTPILALLPLLLLATACGNESLLTTDTGTDSTGTDTNPPSDTTTSDTIVVLPEPDNHRPEEVTCDSERPATEYLPGPDDGEWRATPVGRLRP
jgi:hypothetical protein